MSYAAFTASYMDHLVAFERGYFTEEGLTLNRITVGGGIATQTRSQQIGFQFLWQFGHGCWHPRRTCQGCLYQPLTTRDAAH